MRYAYASRNFRRTWDVVQDMGRWLLVRRTRRVQLAAIVAAAAISIACPPARAAESLPLGETIATLQAQAPISARDGWLLWSVPGAGGWRLEAWHDGALKPLAAKPRPEPFDVNVGTDSSGHPVATYSRCAQTPRLEAAGATRGLGGILTMPRFGRNCRVHVLELESGRESAPPIPHPAGTSDTTPSMWHGRIAFGRRAPGHGTVWQVMLWSPRHRSRLTLLPHGGVPTGCPYKGGCAGQPVRGEVQGLSLDANILAFVWSLTAPGIFGEATWEERVDTLSDARGHRAGDALQGESCTSDEPVEEEWPEPPSVMGTQALFFALERGKCYARDASGLLSFNRGSRGTASLPLTGVAFASEGKSLYALLATPPAPGPEIDPGECSAASPCLLQRIAQPTLAPSNYKPIQPYESLEEARRTAGSLLEGPAM